MAERRVADEVRDILVDPQDLTGPSFQVERWGTRFLVRGPYSPMLVHSCAARSWHEATLEGRRKWTAMDPVIREKYHGPKGSYRKVWSYA